MYNFDYNYYNQVPNTADFLSPYENLEIVEYYFEVIEVCSNCEHFYNFFWDEPAIMSGNSDDSYFFELYFDYFMFSSVFSYSIESVFFYQNEKNICIKPIVDWIFGNETTKGACDYSEFSWKSLKVNEIGESSIYLESSESSVYLEKLVNFEPYYQNIEYTLTDYEIYYLTIV